MEIRNDIISKISDEDVSLVFEILRGRIQEIFDRINHINIVINDGDIFVRETRAKWLRDSIKDASRLQDAFNRLGLLMTEIGLKEVENERT